MTTRETIRRRARDLFAEQGLPGFSMRKVARLSGVSATAIYRHFRDKDALLADVMARGFDVLAGHLNAALSGASALERFRLAVEAYASFALQHPRDYVFMFVTNHAGLGLRASGEASGRIREVLEFFRMRAVECRDAGIPLRAEPEELALRVLAELHGLASLRLSGRLLDSATGRLETFAERAVATLLQA